MNETNDKSIETKKTGHHFMHAVLDSDRKNNPMPKNAAASILKKILEFFSHYRRDERRKNDGEK